MSQLQTSKAMQLPPEIVCEIFKNFSTAVLVHMPTSIPWFLGQICAGWRRVFLSMTAHFWGDLVIDLREGHRPSSVENFRSALDILKGCLKYSAGCPLSFKFYMRSSPYGEENPYVVGMLEELVRQSMRWLKVKFRLQSAELQRLRCAKGHTPLLQFISFRIIGRSGSAPPADSGTEHFADAFLDSPSLTQLRLSHLRTWRFDWSSILILQLSLGTDAHDLISVLSQTTRLEELRTAGIAYRRDQPLEEIQNLVTLPSLKRLSVHGSRTLEVLNAPNLEYLSLGGFPDVDTVTAFICRSACPLRHLTLRNFNPQVFLPDILQFVHGLSRLQIHLRNILERVIKLFRCDGMLPRVPRLKSLVFSSSTQLRQESLEELCAMVASRTWNPNVTSLKKLSLEFNGRSSPGVDLTTLETLCAERGVRLTVQVLAP